MSKVIIESYIDTDYWIPTDNVIVIYGSKYLIEHLCSQYIDCWCPSNNVIVINADKSIIKYLETEIVEGRL